MATQNSLWKVRYKKGVEAGTGQHEAHSLIDAPRETWRPDQPQVWTDLGSIVCCSSVRVDNRLCGSDFNKATRVYVTSYKGASEAMHSVFNWRRSPLVSVRMEYTFSQEYSFWKVQQCQVLNTQYAYKVGSFCPAICLIEIWGKEMQWTLSDDFSICPCPSSILSN
jgi:hypothetical protein